ncbi:MAG: DUF1257 domain-containing protein [Candidatus Blackburnbacteria bacterium]|nr:DUF1257 domain-containing protein [Candidatus Blackburnbacteria bacterium]
MSHYTIVCTELSDTETLIEALVTLGFKRQVIEVHKEAQTLFGYQGDARPQKAHVIIRRKNTGLGASNDVGFEKQANGKYKAHISDYDRGSFNDMWMAKLRQEYAVAGITKKVRGQGKMVSTKREKDGRVKIEITGY